MKLTAFGIIFFFICLNLSFYVINQTELFPYYIPGTETPQSIENMTYLKIISSVAILITGTLVGIFLNVLVQASSIALIIAVLNYLYEPITWVFTGFPLFLSRMGVPLVIYTVVEVIFAFTFFWFLVGIIGQRYTE